MTKDLFSAPKARTMLLGALLLGVTADVLMFEPPWRSGLSLWILAALAVAAYCTREATAHGTAAFARDRLILAGALMLGAAGFTFRDAPGLYVLCFLSTLCAAALLAWRAARLSRSLSDVQLIDLAGIPFQAGIAAAFGAPLLALRDSQTAAPAAAAPSGASSGTPATRPNTRPLLLAGIVFAAPVVIVVGLLLSSADPVFRALVTRWLDLPFEQLVPHVVMIAVFSWLAAGWLRSFVRPVDLTAVAKEFEALRPASGYPLIAPAMYAVIALLVLFLGVQARALFGGAAYVELTSGLTYAEYAREGFFGLVVVTGLVLGLIVAGDWIIGRPGDRDLRRFRTAGFVLLALVMVLVASAAQRLALYMSLYGLTDSRVYAAAFTMTLALAVAWCGATVMRGRRERFAPGLLALGAFTVLSLHLLNPERLVVGVNAMRAAQGEEFDVEYHASLSADALPSLMDAAQAMAHERCVALVLALHETWDKRLAQDAGQGRGAWSLPRARAARLLSPPAERVTEAVCGPG